MISLISHVKHASIDVLSVKLWLVWLAMKSVYAYMHAYMHVCIHATCMYAYMHVSTLFPNPLMFMFVNPLAFDNPTHLSTIKIIKDQNLIMYGQAPRICSVCIAWSGCMVHAFRPVSKKHYSCAVIKLINKGTLWTNEFTSDQVGISHTSKKLWFRCIYTIFLRQWNSHI